MRQGTKREIRKAPALGLRSRLVLGTALATSAFLGGYRGYVRRAFAACAVEGGIYVCRDELTETQTLTGTPLTVTTANGGDIPTSASTTRVDNEGSGGDAFTLTGTDGLTFTDEYEFPHRWPKCRHRSPQHGEWRTIDYHHGDSEWGRPLRSAKGEVSGGQGIEPRTTPAVAI